MITWNFPGILGIVASAFLAMLMLKVAFQPTRDKMAKLLFLLLLFGLLSLIFALLYSYLNLFIVIPHVALTNIFLLFWIGPAFHAYVYRITTGKSPFKKRFWFIHWLPGILLELTLFPYFFMTFPEKVHFFQDTAMGAFFVTQVWLVLYIHILLYLLLSQPAIHHYKRNILETRSDTAHSNLLWLQIFSYGFTIYLYLEGLFPLYRIYAAFGITIPSPGYYFLMIFFFLMIVLTYSALGQNLIITVDDDIEDDVKEKYSRSGLREDSARFYLGKLTALMENEQYYLENDISLKTLSERLKMSPHHLSQILNEQINKNFYDYINEQRIEFSKHLLISRADMSITNIAFESGYNNKFSFYNSFKRYVGMTPSAFREQSGKAESL